VPRRLPQEQDGRLPASRQLQSRPHPFFNSLRAYLAAVGRIGTPLAPCLAYRYQEAIAASFRRLFAARGPAIERAYVRNVEESPYGELHDLRRFKGLVRCWTD
jgi:hypothetical protein